MSYQIEKPSLPPPISGKVVIELHCNGVLSSQLLINLFCRRVHNSGLLSANQCDILRFLWENSTPYSSPLIEGASTTKTGSLQMPAIA